MAGSRVGGWLGDESTGGAGGGGGGRREEEDEEEEEGEMRGRTRPLELLSGPSGLDSGLRHIVQQLERLTQVRGGTHPHVNE